MAGAYQLYALANAEPSVHFYGSMGVYTSMPENSASLTASYFSSAANFNVSTAEIDRVSLYVSVHHTGNGDADFIVVLTGQAQLTDTSIDAHDGLAVRSQVVKGGWVSDDSEYQAWPSGYQIFLFTLRGGVTQGFVEINGYLKGDVVDHRAAATVIRLPTMGALEPLFESAPAQQASQHFSASATPDRRWFTPKNLKNVANAGDLDINTVVDVARPSLDPAYRSLLIWSGPTLYSPEAHLTNAVQRRRNEGIFFGAGILAGLASSLLVEAVVATLRRDLSRDSSG
jgi:hypothetical protein